MESHTDKTPRQLAPKRISEQEGFARFLHEALDEAFGVGFALWAPGEPGSDPPATQPGSYPPELRDTVSQFFQKSAIGRRKPCLVEPSGDGCWLAIPFVRDGRLFLAATAQFETPDRDLLLRLACLFVREFAERQEMEAQREEIEEYRLQISEDLEELVFLRQVAERLVLSDGARGVFELAGSVLALLQPLAKVECAVMIPADGEQQTLDRAADGGHPGYVRVGQPIAGPEVCHRLIERYGSAATRQPVVKNHFHQTPEGADFPGIREFVLVPVERSDRRIAWLLAFNRVGRDLPGHATSEWHLSDLELGSCEASLLSSTASIFATYASNVELFREKERLFIDLVRALVSAMEAKDAYTRGHSERVARFACRLGQELGLGEEACQQLNLMGLLHDIGKIGVRDAVLQKPGRLTEEEFAEIKRHPDLASAILHELESLHEVMPGVEHHHERYDGQGYPDALAGEQIPLTARILAVADAYDAMTSDRPYRTGIPQAEAEAILRQGVGSQWDPDIVETFLRIMPEIIGIRQSSSGRFPTVPLSLTDSAPGQPAAGGLPAGPAPAV
jgi:HD-GYP domain-containing protein (c-di-GMP phosphodiesterase class II)